jgi:hypothetical protein
MYYTQRGKEGGKQSLLVLLQKVMNILKEAGEGGGSLKEGEGKISSRLTSSGG